MVLSLGIRLVITLPTLLFLIGFILKAFIEEKGLAKIINKHGESSREIIDELWVDFGLIFFVDSILLVIANSLIIMYELKSGGFEIIAGIISLLIGIVLSIFGLIGTCRLIRKPFILGISGISGLFGAQFAYFLLYETEFLDSSNFGKIAIFVATIASVSIGYRIVKMSYPLNEKKDK